MITPLYKSLGPINIPSFSNSVYEPVFVYNNSFEIGGASNHENGWWEYKGGNYEGWFFDEGGCGVATPASPWSNYNIIPHGGSFVFLQSVSSVSQTIYNLVPGASYQIEFALNGRFGAQQNPMNIYFVGTQATDAANGNSIFLETSTPYFVEKKTNPIVSNTTEGILKFKCLGSNGADVAALLDNVRIKRI